MRRRSKHATRRAGRNSRRAAAFARRVGTLEANVNLNAQAERDEVAEREAFLRAQLDDLARARATLLESIAEIERDSQVQFNRTFERVAAAFTDTYARLFAGGNAKMWQT